MTVNEFLGIERKPIFVYQRVSVWPGKHGEGDYRVEFSGGAPTHEEILAIAGWVWRAEDRYNKPGHRGRSWLKDELDRVYWHSDEDELVEILDEVRKTKPASCV